MNSTDACAVRNTRRNGRSRSVPIWAGGGIPTRLEESYLAIRFHEENGGKTLAVHVSGKLAAADYEDFVPEFERLVRLHGTLRVLFEMTGLHDWTAGALWADTKF